MQQSSLAGRPSDGTTDRSTDATADRTTDGATAGARWVGAGHSSAEDPYLRGREAILAAQAQAGGEPSLVIVLADVDGRLAEVLEGVRRGVRGNPAIVGCTTVGELTAAGPLSRGVAVLALGGPGFGIRITVERDLSADQREVGGRVAGCLDGLAEPHRVLILLSDGLVAQHDLIRGVYAVAGAGVPLVGGYAGDDMRFERTLQFAGDGGGVEIFSEGVIGIGLGSQAPIGIGIAHGWRKTGEPMTITSSSGGHIYELDGERAFEAFLSHCDAPPLDLADRRSLGYWAHQHPFGMSRRSGEDIRTLHTMNPDDGSLVCLADVQQGALAWMMESDEDSLIACAADSCRQAMAKEPSTPPLGMLVFDCCARKTMLGAAGIEAEVRGVIDAVGQIPFAGFYTFGEIARVHGARGMHQMTVVSLALW
jgi:hypothetical protein